MNGTQLKHLNAFPPPRKFEGGYHFHCKEHRARRYPLKKYRDVWVSVGMSI